MRCDELSAKGCSFNGGGVAGSHGVVFSMCGYGFTGALPGKLLLAFSVDER